MKRPQNGTFVFTVACGSIACDTGTTALDNVRNCELELGYVCLLHAEIFTFNMRTCLNEISDACDRKTTNSTTNHQLFSKCNSLSGRSSRIQVFNDFRNCQTRARTIQNGSKLIQDWIQFHGD